jgi:hypothetical protein
VSKAFTEDLGRFKGAGHFTVTVGLVPSRWNVLLAKKRTS